MKTNILQTSIAANREPCRTKSVNSDRHDSCQLSANWWDEVSEAKDLANFVQCLGECNVVIRSAGSNEDCSNRCCHETCVGEDSSATDFSATSSEVDHESTVVIQDSCATFNHQDCLATKNSLESNTLYPSRLKIIAAKIALNSGKEHLSTSGKVRKARRVRSPCHSSCRRCHVPRLSEAERFIVFDHFWSLKSHEMQWMFISNAVKVSRPKRKFAVKGSKGEKSCSRVYYLNIKGRERKVCKTMFKNTLCICDSWIDSALSHFARGAYVPDLRGRRKL